MDIPFHVLGVTHQQIAMLGHHLLGELPILAYRSAPLGTHPFMSVRIDVQLAAEPVDLALEMRSKRTDTACKNIDDRVRYMMRLDILHALIQCGHVVIDGLGRSNVRHLDLEAAGIVIHETATLSRLARHMIPQRGIGLMILRQIVDEGLIPAIIRRDSLGPDDEHMLYRHSFFPNVLLLRPIAAIQTGDTGLHTSCSPRHPRGAADAAPQCGQL